MSLKLRQFIRFFIILVTGISLTTLEIGSSTDSAYFSERSEIFFNEYQYKFDNLIFSYDKYLQDAINNNMSPGAAVAVVYRGSILLMKGYGVKEAGKADSIDANTVFRLGSVSKGFASVLAGVLEQEGYFNWEDKAFNYISDLKLKDTTFTGSLTIRNILSQSSGFPQHTYTDLLDNGWSYDRIREMMPSVSIAYQPGRLYTYQNVVYSFIADIIDNACGQSYNDLIKEKIFKPLDMVNASTDYLSISNGINSAHPHLSTRSGWRERPFNDRYYCVSPASGINASISDMANWLLALTGNYPQVIPYKTINDISSINVYTPLTGTYRKYWKSLQKTAYGLGWRVFDLKERDVVYHGGYVEGFRTEIAFDPQEEMGIVVMFNSNTTFASECIPHFFEMFDKNIDVLAQNNAGKGF